jgi:hypothetical protein
MVMEATLNARAVPKDLSSDAGYYSARAMEELRALGVDPPRHQV